MNDHEFELELESLIRSERNKEAYHPESVEKERLAVVMAFYDHYATLSELEGVCNLDDFLEKLNADVSMDEDDMEDDGPNQVFIDNLNELIQQDIEKYPVLTEGEMLVRGNGLYMFDPDVQGDVDLEINASSVGIEEIEEGMSLIGEIKGYVVAPMISYELFARWQVADSYDEFDTRSRDESPGLWLLMKNVSITDVNGFPQGTLDEALVPMNYPGVTFDKVIRHSASVEKLKAEQETKVPVSTHFKGDFIVGVFNTMENDLNYNEHTVESLQEAHDVYMQELSIYMAAVDGEEPLNLTVFNSISPEGNEEGFENRTARYLDSVFMKPRDEWRILHAFLVEDGDKLLLRHVLTEDILDIKRQKEE